MRTGYRARSDEQRNLLNSWAATLVLFIPLVLRSWVETDSSRYSQILGAVAALSLLTVSLTTFSRASVLVLILTLGFVSTLLAYDYFLFSSRFSRFLLRFAVAAFAFAPFGFLLIRYIVPDFLFAHLVYEFWLQRIDAFVEGDASTEVRLAAVGKSLSAWASAPFLGHGNQYEAGIHQPIENTFLNLLISFGVFGLLLYFSVLFLVFKRVLRGWLKGRKGARTLVPAWFFMFILLLGTNDFLTFSTGTIIMAIIMGNSLGRLTGNRKR